MGRKKRQPRHGGAGAQAETATPSFANPTKTLFDAFDKSSLAVTDYLPLMQVNRAYRSGLLQHAPVIEHIQEKKEYYLRIISTFPADWIERLKLKGTDDLSVSELMHYARGLQAVKALSYMDRLFPDDLPHLQPLTTIPADRASQPDNKKQLYAIFYMLLLFKQINSLSWYTCAESCIRHDDATLLQLMLNEKKIDLTSQQIQVPDQRVPITVLHLTAHLNLKLFPKYLLREEACTSKDLAKASIVYATLQKPPMTAGLENKDGVIHLDCRGLSDAAFSYLSRFFLQSVNNAHVMEILTDEPVHTLVVSHLQTGRMHHSAGFFPDASLLANANSQLALLSDFISKAPKLARIVIEKSALSKEQLDAILAAARKSNFAGKIEYAASLTSGCPRERSDDSSSVRHISTSLLSAL